MPRTRDDDTQRERLSEAVFATLAELGPQGLTLRSVAARAGCTTGLVLHTFPNKQALLLHARDVLHQRTKARADALEAGAKDPASAVRAVVLGALPTDDATLAEARAWVAFLSAALGDATLTDRHVVQSRAFTERLARLLRNATGLPAGAARVRAAALAATVEGVSTLTAGDPAQWPADGQRAALGIALDSALAPERPVEPAGASTAPADRRTSPTRSARMSSRRSSRTNGPDPATRPEPSPSPIPGDRTPRAEPLGRR